SEGNFRAAQIVWWIVHDVAPRSDDGFFASTSRNRNHQCDRLFEINFGGSLELFVGQLPLEAEKTGVDGFRLEILEGLHHSVLVVGADGPDGYRGAVFELLIQAVIVYVYHGRYFFLFAFSPPRDRPSSPFRAIGIPP